MPRIQPLDPDANDFVKDLIAKSTENMGFPANSFKTMAHWPELAEAFLQLARTVNFGDTELPVGIKRLVSYVASVSSGCQYCAAHTGFQATRSGGIPAEKIEAAFEYETSPLFTDAERAALRVAQSAASVPNMVTDEDFEELKKHFTDRQIVELVGQVAVFGFLNRWNDTMATELEAIPTRYGDDHLTQSGWSVGKHAAE